MDQARNGEELTQILEKITKRVEELDLEFFLEEIPHATAQSMNGVEQVASIVKAMKQFAHPEQDNLTQVDINAALEQTAVVSRNEWKYNADLRFDLDPASPKVPGYPGPLNQVFLNILVNAAHAIGEQMSGSNEKGRIDVSTRTDEKSVIIEISDNGCGIAPDKIHKVFDPFYTTKEVGKGTGQGLSIVYSIVTEKHKGTIDIVSEVGKGSAFTLRLPLAR